MVLKLREEELQAQIARTKDSDELAKLEAELRDVRTKLSAGGTSTLTLTPTPTPTPTPTLTACPAHAHAHIHMHMHMHAVHKRVYTVLAGIRLHLTYY